MSIIRFCSVFVFILTSVSCGTKPENFPKEEETNAVIVKEIQEKNIVFLYFEITKEENNIEKITLTNSQIVAGSLKENTIAKKPKAEGNLMITLTDEKGTVVEERIIENPLNLTLEQYGDEGMQTQQVQLEKGYFYVRYNQNTSIKSVKIQKIQQKNLILLFTQNL